MDIGKSALAKGEHVVLVKRVVWGKDEWIQERMPRPTYGEATDGAV